ncbi:MAG: CRISPR-associated endonuclease Cas2, partial [Sphingomonadaceae bacterium]|nr:CRISPR-associated endonuclease Cas2 [Sphingomonadaceae bacterium]
MAERQPFLVAYDIRKARRWRRLHGGLKRLAIPVQYSLFYGEFTPATLARVVALIEEVIDPRVDDVRIYPLPRDGWMRVIGRPILPGGLMFTGLPAPFRAPADPPAAAAAP